MSGWTRETAAVEPGKPERCPHDDGWVMFSELSRERREEFGDWFGYQCEVCGQRFAGNQGCLGLVSEEIDDEYTSVTGYGPYVMQIEWCDYPYGHGGPHGKVFMSGEIMEWAR